MRPRSSTKITSAARIVDRRCAIAIVVRSAMRGWSAALDEPLARGVERRGRLVEDQDARILQEHPGDREPLLLASGHPVATLADDGVVAVGEVDDPLVDERRTRGRLELSVGGVRAGVEEVLADGRVEQVRLLRDHADHLGERSERDLADVTPVDRHRASGHVVEPRHEIGDRRLAGPARADDRGELPGLDLERYVLERPEPRRPEQPLVAVAQPPRRARGRAGAPAPRSGSRPGRSGPRREPGRATRSPRRASRRCRARGRGTGRSARRARATTGSRVETCRSEPTGKRSLV